MNIESKIVDDVLSKITSIKTENQDRLTKLQRWSDILTEVYKRLDLRVIECSTTKHWKIDWKDEFCPIGRVEQHSFSISNKYCSPSIHRNTHLIFFNDDPRDGCVLCSQNDDSFVKEVVEQIVRLEKHRFEKFGENYRETLKKK